MHKLWEKWGLRFSLKRSNDDRRSGRTTKMLQTAVACAREGGSVLVYAANMHQVYHMIHLVENMEGVVSVTSDSVSYEGGGRLRVMPLPQTADELHASLRGRDYRLVCVDHYAISMAKPGVLAGLEEWLRRNRF